MGLAAGVSLGSRGGWGLWGGLWGGGRRRGAFLGWFARVWGGIGFGNRLIGMGNSGELFGNGLYSLGIPYSNNSSFVPPTSAGEPPNSAHLRPTVR